MKPSRYQSLKEEALEANLALGLSALVVATFGNASAFDPALGAFAIKPSGVPYDALEVDSMVVVDLDMQVIEGAMRPSSDTNTHAVLYRDFQGLGGIVHTHSPHAVAWAQALRGIPVYGTTHADHLAFPVPCTPIMSDERIEGDYEVETGLQIVEHFREFRLSPAEIEMVLVGGHGPFTWGPTVQKALYHTVILEEVAQMAWLTEQLKPQGARPLKQSLIRKHWERKHGDGAYYGQ